MSDIVDRACDHLDRTRADDPSRVIIMDLLDEISDRKGEIERLRAAVEAEREACAKRAKAAYDEWWDISNKHGDAFRAWAYTEDVREPMPTLNIGSLPDFIAAAIRSRSLPPTPEGGK